MEIREVYQNLNPQPAEATEERGMGKEDFLQLLLTELKYQDPMNSVEYKDLMTQLSQLSQLEQLLNMSQSIEALKGMFIYLALTSAINLVGKTALAEGNTIKVEEGTPQAKVIAELDVPAPRAEVSILDEGGSVIKNIILLNVPNGECEIEWDGTDSVGKPVRDGIYTISVIAYDESGNTFTPELFVEGQVIGTSIEQGKIQVEIGGIEVGLENVRRVKDGLG